MVKNFFHSIPVGVLFGKNTLFKLGKYVKIHGKKALIVTTGTFFKDNGLIDSMRELLQNCGIASEYFHDIRPNPLSTQVDEAASLAKKSGCDVIIGLGGGSAMDAAKAIAVAAGHDSPVWKYCFIGDKKKVPLPTAKTLPVIAIPTTPGSGSQISQWSMVTNPDTREKVSLGSDFTFPKLAIVDPVLLSTLPKRFVIASSFDVLAHAIEAYTSHSANPITDMYCEQTMRIIGKNIRRIVTDLDDEKARTNMALAGTLGGFAISVAVITLCHGIGHVIGGVSGAVHGEILAALTPHTMRFSMQNRLEKFKNIAVFLKDECVDTADYQAEDSVIEVEKIIMDIGINNSLKNQGVKESDFEEITEATFRNMDMILALDPKQATKEDVMDLLKKAF